ncbi:MAG: branched-chain amino acid ABC transporter permease [Desulfomonile tiedjei]|uniref:Branched-chain amino acid ABC transporter permease n=1 Tax=Desulfomonile tiedjei TaxID=2358 RepID=A0A9D6UZQ0_9BACT|nr:branched-chain amino acid ABC transporter permease [Desulfomonile tiedjei]
MLLQVIVSGIATGCIYSLMALGLTLIYKSTGHVNFAQGEMSMLSGFVAFTMFHILGFSVTFSLFICLLSSIVIGLVMERLLVRPAIRAPHFNVFIITLGASIVMQSGAGLIWTHDQFLFPSAFPSETFSLGFVRVNGISLGIIATTGVLMLVLYFFFKYSKTGTAMRAVSESQNAALLMGISVKRSFALTWAISGFISGVGAVLIAPVIFLSTRMGLVVINGFAAAILGGWGSIPGAVLGGIMLGILENVAPYYFPSQIRNIIPFAVLVGVLIIKPTGIMGEEEKRRV